MNPKEPISKDAYEHLKRNLPQMKGKEKEKTIKRLQMFDRGFVKRHDHEVEKE